MKILVIGSGYVGQRCASAWPEAVLSKKKIFSLSDAQAVLSEHQPDVVLNAAGIVGKPNVDWCEDHQEETFFGNTIMPYFLAKACQEKGVYLLHIGSGCIFYGDSPHGQPWTEDDFANPQAVYTKSKYAADLMLGTFPDVGIGRIRMPIDHISYYGNLLDKLAHYPKLIDVENSITVIDDMVEVFYKLMEKKASGIFHVVNPGSIKHRQIIDLYKKYIDPQHNNEWISEQDLVRLGLAKKTRSNNIMSSQNLKAIGIKMRPILEAVEDTIKKYKQSR